jgi:hypothetical protein
MHFDVSVGATTCSVELLGMLLIGSSQLPTIRPCGVNIGSVLPEGEQNVNAALQRFTGSTVRRHQQEEDVLGRQL